MSTHGAGGRRVDAPPPRSLLDAADLSSLRGDDAVATTLSCLFDVALTFDPDEPRWGDRDRLVVGAPHLEPRIRAAAADVGAGSTLVETATAGAALAAAVGYAAAARADGDAFRVVALVEGRARHDGGFWEAALAAASLGALTVVAVDDGDAEGIAALLALAGLDTRVVTPAPAEILGALDHGRAEPDQANGVVVAATSGSRVPPPTSHAEPVAAPRGEPGAASRAVLAADPRVIVVAARVGSAVAEGRWVAAPGAVTRLDVGLGVRAAGRPAALVLEPGDPVPSAAASAPGLTLLPATAAQAAAASQAGWRVVQPARQADVATLVEATLAADVPTALRLPAAACGETLDANWRALDHPPTGEPRLDAGRLWQEGGTCALVATGGGAARLPALARLLARRGIEVGAVELCAVPPRSPLDLAVSDDTVWVAAAAALPALMAAELTDVDLVAIDLAGTAPLVAADAVLANVRVK